MQQLYPLEILPYFVSISRQIISLSCSSLAFLYQVNRIFSENAFDAVMHFAAVAYVGESTREPLRLYHQIPTPLSLFAYNCICFLMSECRLSLCRYYHNITSNTMLVVKAMEAHGVKTLIYSSTCATYGEPEKMPITEITPQVSCKKWGCILLKISPKFDV